MSERIKNANRRYRVEFGLAMALYAAVLIGAKFLAKNVNDWPFMIGLALAPVAPVILASMAFMRYYRSTDERDRRIVADSAALSLLISILCALTLGFLKSFEVFYFESDMLWFAPFMIALWGVVKTVLARIR